MSNQWNPLQQLFVRGVWMKAASLGEGLFLYRKQKAAYSHHVVAANEPAVQSVWQDSALSLSPQIAIWHSTPDQKYAERLSTHLRSKVRQDCIKYWDMRCIQPGDRWEEKRKQVLQSAAIVVLLISPDFMANDLIAGRELPSILHREQCQGTLVLLLHVSPCDFIGSGLEKLHPINSAEKPLVGLSRAERDKVFSKTVQVVCQQLGI